jgi:site-specific recombinase XerD
VRPDIDQMLRATLDQYAVHLEGANKAQKTIQTYLEGAELFAEYLALHGLPQDLTAVTRSYIDGFLKDLRDAGCTPATVDNRFRALKALFRYLVKHLEVMDRSPMEGMQQPQVPIDSPDPLTIDEQEALRAVCRGKDFLSRRDLALLELLLATPGRRQEIAALTVDDVHVRDREIRVLQKGGTHRTMKYNHRAADALAKYLLVRPKSPYAHTSRTLWLGTQGPLTPNGMYQVIRRLGKDAGVPRLFVHLFRHTYADTYLDRDGQEGDLMQHGGWTTPHMIRTRYAKRRAATRARSHYDDIMDR